MGDSSHGRMNRSMAASATPRKNNMEEVARRRAELLQEQEQMREQQKAKRDERAARAADQKNQILARQRDNIRRELTRSKQVLDRKAQLQVEEKEKRAAVLSKAHANASRLAQNKSRPMFAFGSSTPRELGYLTQLTKEQKVYDRKLQPSPPPPGSQTATPQRRVPRGHSPSSRDMTTSLYTTRLRAKLAPNTMTQSMVNPPSKLAAPHLAAAASAVRANRPRLAPNSAASRATPLRMKDSVPSSGDRPTHKTVVAPRKTPLSASGSVHHPHPAPAMHTNRKGGIGVAEQKRADPEAGVETKKIARRVAVEGVHDSQIAENAQVNSDSPLKPLHQDSGDTQSNGADKQQAVEKTQMPEAHKQEEGEELLVVVKAEAEQKEGNEDTTPKSDVIVMDVIKESSVENDADEQRNGGEESTLTEEQTMAEDSGVVDTLRDTSNVQTANDSQLAAIEMTPDEKAQNEKIKKEKQMSTGDILTETLFAVTEEQQRPDAEGAPEVVPMDVDDQLSETRIMTEDLFVLKEAHIDKLDSSTEQYSEGHEASVLRGHTPTKEMNAMVSQLDSSEITPRSEQETTDPAPLIVTSEHEHKKTLEVAHYEPKMDEANNGTEGDAQEASVSTKEHVVVESEQKTTVLMDKAEEKTAVAEDKREDDVKKTPSLDETTLAQQQRQAALKQRADQEQKEREERKARLAAIMRGRTRAGAPTAVVAPTQSSLITDESGVAEPLKDVERPATGADAAAPHVFSQTTASILQKLASSKPRLMSVLQRNGSNPSLADELTAADPMMNLPGQPDDAPTAQKQTLSQSSPPKTPLQSQDFKTSLAMN